MSPHVCVFCLQVEKMETVKVMKSPIPAPSFHEHQKVEKPLCEQHSLNFPNHQILFLKVVCDFPPFFWKGYFITLCASTIS